jgi:excinuclease ABC subunit A
MVQVMSQLPLQTKLHILAPLVQNEKGTHKDTFTKIKTSGFERVRVNGAFYRLEDVPVLDKNKKHVIDIVIDRLIVNPESRTRLYDAVTLALDWSKGYVVAFDGNKDHLFSSHHACKYCGFSVPKLEPRLFSFNAPSGSCPDCHGLGIKREADVNRIIPDMSLSIQQGGINFYKNMIGTTNLYWQEFKKLCELYQIPLDRPLQKLSKDQLKVILFGSPKMHQYQLQSASGNIMNRFDFIEGIKIKLERLYNETQSEGMRELYERYFTDRECTTCKGARLNPQVLSVQVGKKNIDESTRMSMIEFIDWMKSTEGSMSESHRTIARLVIKEILSRAGFLMNVGLDYLTLSRMAMTLSGGEAQRIRLATQIGSQLTGVLYVLDEPSIGLHQRDNRRLINTLKTMRDLGNTVIVVEHDEETMREADFIVDIGPGAGAQGGEVVAQGKIEDIIASPRSVTGQYLSGKKSIPLPKYHQSGNGKFIHIIGAQANNLKKINVKIPLGKLVVVTGVSGSGKSTLINDILYEQILKELNDADVNPGKHTRIEGLQHLDKVINISQEPIGRTPRSNPATYTKVFDEIRDLFAETLEAKTRGFEKGRFSFNVPGGRCEACQGDGGKRIPMNFLPDVYVKCEACEGKRYNEETLLVYFKDKNIHDVLQLTVDDAQVFFNQRVEIARRLKTLHEVGLGYMRLGQSATTLSGGEAQRVKLAFELQKRPTGKTLYILDEPTTGLHIDDVARLVRVLQAIVAQGDSVLVIEHNLDVIKVADHVIDLGPEGGHRGGEIVAEGTPEEVSKVKGSFTGQFLKPYLK